MSWSFNAIGKAESFPKFLADESARLTGDFKAEFDAARPHIEGLIGLNNSTSSPVMLDVQANGHAWKSGDQHGSQCNVSIKPVPGRLLP